MQCHHPFPSCFLYILNHPLCQKPKQNPHNKTQRSKNDLGFRLGYCSSRASVVHVCASFFVGRVFHFASWGLIHPDLSSPIHLLSSDFSLLFLSSWMPCWKLIPFSFVMQFLSSFFYLNFIILPLWKISAAQSDLHKWFLWRLTVWSLVSFPN